MRFGLWRCGAIWHSGPQRTVALKLLMRSESVAQRINVSEPVRY